MKKTFIPTGVILGLLLTGCSTGPGQPQIHTINSQSKEISINLNFPKKDPVTNQPIKIYKGTLLKKIKDKMYSFSKYHKFRVIRYGPIDDYAGIEIKRDTNYYNINYKNGEYYKDSNDWFLTEVKFQIPYEYNNNFIKLIYPNKYTIIPCNDAIGMKIDLLDNPSNLKKDVFNILNNLKNTKLYLSKRYILEGEINTKYPSNAIYANFKRLLGQYIGGYYWAGSKAKISPIEKENTFNLKIKNEVYPINIKIYPYRNGSKVIYKAYISYKMYSDGTSTLTKQDIENAKKEIERVVND